MRLFISHSTADDAIANQVYDGLTAAGYEVWVDHINGISYGAKWQDEIEKAIIASDAGLLLVSHESAASKWCKIEVNELEERKKPIYTVLLTGAIRDDVPLALRLNQHADLAQGLDAVLTKLIAVITGKAAPDATAPAAAHTPRLTGFDTYELEYYPLLRSLPLAGRVDELSQIKTAPQEAIVQIVAIGGRGKSRLAYEAATTAGGAVWHRMTAASDAEEALGTLKRHLGLPREADADTTYAALAARPTLLVLDNAEDVPAGDPRRAGYLNLMSRARGAGARVLLTSRVEWKELKPRKVIDLDPLPADPALRAAQAMNTALEAGASESDLNRIVAGAKGHPRLMEWVLNQIGGEHIGAKTALHDLETLQSQDAQDMLDEMVLKTLAQMERESRDGGAAAQALRLWCVFRGSFTLAAAVAIFKSPLPAAQDNLPLTNTPRAAESERGFRGETSDSAERLLATLQSWKFVRKLTDDRYALDELVIQAVTAAGQVPDGAAQAHFDHYEARLGDYDRNNKPENHPAITADLDNVEAALAWGWAAAPKRTVDWVDALRFYLQLSYQYERWRRLTERAIKVAQTQRYQYGEAYALQALGDLDRMEDRYGEARANYQEALVAYRAIPDRLGEANTLQALGDLDLQEARYGEARANYQEALVAYRAIPSRLGEANTLQALGELDRMEDRYGEARANYQEALVAYRAIPSRLGEANTLQALGDLDLREARYGEARANYQAALVAYRAIPSRLGEAHTLRALGDLDRMEDRYGEARANYQAALVAYRALPSRLGEAHTRKALGDLDLREARYGEARANYQAALNLYITIGNRPSAGNCWRGLALLADAEQKGVEAERHYCHALQIQRDLAQQHPAFLRVLDTWETEYQDLIRRYSLTSTCT